MREIILIIFFFCHSVGSEPENETEVANDNISKFLKLLEDYDKEIPPSGYKGEPTIVMVNAYINSFGSISAATMDYSLDLFLRQSWRDPRLALGSLSRPYLSLTEGKHIDKIWNPGVYFKNIKKGVFHQVPEPNIYLRVDKDGNVEMSMRLTVTLSCQMKLQYYPQDIQYCYMNMGIYSYESDFVKLQWTDKYGVKLADNIEVPEFNYPEIHISDEDCVDHFTTGSFSCLSVKFKIWREYRYHLIQTYVPMVLITMVSWVSCWLHPGAIPARVTLGVTTLLSLTTLASGVRTRLPPVSYVKAIDVWMGACSVYVFASLLEFTMVNYLYRRKDEGSDAMKKARSLDWTCRIFFPVSFFIFVIAYWKCFTEN